MEEKQRNKEIVERLEDKIIDFQSQIDDDDQGSYSIQEVLDILEEIQDG